MLFMTYREVTTQRLHQSAYITGLSLFFTAVHLIDYSPWGCTIACTTCDFATVHKMALLPFQRNETSPVQHSLGNCY